MFDNLSKVPNGIPKSRRELDVEEKEKKKEKEKERGRRGD